MTTTVPVAVIIPAYNAAPYIEVALRSVLQQTLPPQEILVVDDGSTDGTAGIAERLGANVIRQTQRGPAAARNRGIAASSAPLLAFLDADDWYAPAKLEREVERLQELGASCVCSDAWLVRGERVLSAKNDGKDVPSVLTLERLLRGNPIICSTVVVRREAVVAVGMFDEDPTLIATEDYDLWLRLARVEPIAYLAEPLAFYRLHEGSLSTNVRFLPGVDRILDKVEREFVEEAHFLNLIKRRRAEVRLDAAWELLQHNRNEDARKMLLASLQQTVTWKGLRMWARCMMPRSGRRDRVGDG